MGIITISREFGSGGRELGKRLADELTEWLDLADEDLVPHCYLAGPGVELAEQVRTVAQALVWGRQIFYIGGEYYDHLYDALRPRGASPADRFASLGVASAAVGDTAWVPGLRSLVQVEGEGKGPRHDVLVALPQGVEDVSLEARLEAELEDSLPFHANAISFCPMAPGEEILVLLLQSSIAASRVAMFNALADVPGADDYFTARDDR